jgi:hypothetical protein
VTRIARASSGCVVGVNVSGFVSAHQINLFERWQVAWNESRADDRRRSMIAHDVQRIHDGTHSAHFMNPKQEHHETERNVCPCEKVLHARMIADGGKSGENIPAQSFF